jgi:hypothetical protein
MLIHENAISKTYYDPGTHLLTLEFYGLMQRDLGLEQIEKILKFIEDKEVWGAVADITRLRGSFIKIFETLRKNYYPAVGKKGHKCKAIVVSDDIITEHLAAKLKDLIYEFDMEVQIFKDREKADHWLLQTVTKYYPVLQQDQS